MQSVKPNFLIIGVPKAGTTSLYKYLKAHPDIFMPETTELRYFNRNEMLSNLNGPADRVAIEKICSTWEKYINYFSAYTSETAVGECTTSYLYSSQTYKEIKERLGNQVKLIVVLREPVSRAFSNYLYYVRRDREKHSFREAVDAEGQRVKEGWNNAWYNIRHSLYADKIQNLMDSGLPFKIVLYEDFRDNPLMVVQELYAFLGVNRNVEPGDLNIVYNRGGVYKSKSLIKWMLRPSTTRKVIKMLFPPIIIENLRTWRDKFISNHTKPVKIDPDIAKELKTYFKDDVHRLATLQSIDVSKWGY